ncbi:hypothetical protein OF83DRAFT_1133670 [Amylostereum chailletii]|nr:hypothetical protein OF83DRAFT_1133670 [Amylostereum chailletii]
MMNGRLKRDVGRVGGPKSVVNQFDPDPPETAVPTRLPLPRSAPRSLRFPKLPPTSVLWEVT